MDKTLNKKCLQEPKSQTWPRDNAFYKPHVFVKATKRQIDMEHSPYESGRSLEAWMIQEERAIQARFRSNTINI